MKFECNWNLLHNKLLMTVGIVYFCHSAIQAHFILMCISSIFFLFSRGIKGGGGGWKPQTISIYVVIQSTPLNRVILVPEHFDPIKRSELILFLWFCSWPSDPIKRSRLYIH